jgi:hypothetical protein
MPKPTVIDIPYPTLDEVSRTYGISPSRRKRLERQIQDLVSGGAAKPGRPHRRSSIAARTARKK